MNAKDIIIAIDPGVYGYATIFENEIIIEFIPLPFFEEIKYRKNKKPRVSKHTDILEFSKKILQYKNRIKAICIEKVTSDGMGNETSMFTFGGNYRVIEGLAIGWEVPFLAIPVQEWQKAVGYSVVKKIPPKEKSSFFAQKYFENTIFPVDEKTSKLVDGATDAALIGYYGIKKIKSLEKRNKLN